MTAPVCTPRAVGSYVAWKRMIGAPARPEPPPPRRAIVVSDRPEVDGYARAAGLEPEARWGTWAATPRTGADPTFIPVFRR